MRNRQIKSKSFLRLISECTHHFTLHKGCLRSRNIHPALAFPPLWWARNLASHPDYFPVSLSSLHATEQTTVTCSSQWLCSSNQIFNTSHLLGCPKRVLVNRSIPGKPMHITKGQIPWERYSAPDLHTGHLRITVWEKSQERFPHVLSLISAGSIDRRQDRLAWDNGNAKEEGKPTSPLPLTPLLTSNS